MARLSAGATLLTTHPLLADEDGIIPTLVNTTATAKNTSFGSIKQINAGVLNVGYVEAGPANGSPVILLHGWPYDIHSFVDVSPFLANAGHRVIVPYLRGYGGINITLRRSAAGPAMTNTGDFAKLIWQPASPKVT